MTLSARAKAWFDDPDGGESFPGQRDAIRAHDPTCLSLPHAWLPTRSGVSCDLGSCEDCRNVTFYAGDGAISYGWYDPEILDERGDVRDLCECCARKYRSSIEEATEDERIAWRQIIFDFVKGKEGTEQKAASFLAATPHPHLFHDTRS